MSPKKSNAEPAAPPLVLIDPADGAIHAGWFGKDDAKLARRLARKFKCHVLTGDATVVNDVVARIEPGRIEGDRLYLGGVTKTLAEELRRFLQTVPEASEGDAAAANADYEPTVAADLAQADAEGLGALAADDAAGPQETFAGDGQGTDAADSEQPAVALDDGGGAPSEADAATPLAAPDSAATENAAPDNAAPLEPAVTAATALSWDALKVGDLVLGADLDKKGEPEAWYEAIIVRITPITFILRFRDYPHDGLLARTRRHVALMHPSP